MVKHIQTIRRQFLDYDCKWLYTLKSVFVQFRRNFKGPPFYSGGFPEQKKTYEVLLLYKNFENKSR